MKIIALITISLAISTQADGECFILLIEIFTLESQINVPNGFLFSNLIKVVPPLLLYPQQMT